MMIRIWTDVVIDGDRLPYRINQFGEVFSFRSKKILKPCVRGSRNGAYPVVRMFHRGKTYRIDVHRLVALHFCLNLDGKDEVNHIDEDHDNFHAFNLEWMTRSENQLYRNTKPGNRCFISERKNHVRIKQKDDKFFSRIGRTEEAVRSVRQGPGLPEYIVNVPCRTV